MKLNFQYYSGQVFNLDQKTMNLMIEDVENMKAGLATKDAEIADWKRRRESALHEYEKREAELFNKLTVALKALKYYESYIPMYRVITPESAAYEKEYGIGRVAREALTTINKLGKPETK